MLAGQVFDQTGGYDYAFATLAVMMTLALILTRFLPGKASTEAVIPA